MKLTMTRPGLQLFTMLVLFSTWLFSVARADAQVLSNKSNDWKTESEALDKLDSELLQLAVVLNGQTPGTLDYLNTEARADYYKNIYNLVEQGKSVAEAIQLALGYVDTTWLGFDYSPQVLSAKTQWYNDALAILTN